MKIINPLYDQAFKYLMDNQQLAKKVMSIILEKEVIAIQTKATEIPLLDKRREIPLSRFDFKAIIRTPDNKEQNVLIEVQKSKNPNPIMRFRRYLGKSYLRQETFINQYGVEESKPIPIITIYFLGYKLAEYDTPAIIVNNTVIDATTKLPILIKNEFVELLTHPSYIIQVERLRKERKTKLEKFLSFFDQKLKTDDDFILEIDETKIETDLQDIARYLNLASQDEDIIRSLEYEEDYEKGYVTLENQLAENEKKLEEERKQKEEERKQKEEQTQKITNMILKRHKKGMSVKEIAEDLELTEKEVNEIINNWKRY